MGCGINEIKRAPWPSQYEMAGLRVSRISVEADSVGNRGYCFWSGTSLRRRFFVRETKLNNHGFCLQQSRG